MTSGIKNTIKLLIAGLLGLIICAVAVLLIVNPSNMFKFEKEKSSTVNDGIALIKTMEATPTAPIEDEIYRKKKDEIIAQFYNNPDRIWPTMIDYNLILSGDSRGIGFSTSGFLDFSHNLSNYSKTIYNLPENYEAFVNLNPKKILICYGINDVGLYYSNGVEQYMSDLEGFINEIRELVPGVDVYVNSIPPCLPSEYERSPVWSWIPDWNVYIKNYCAEHDIHYVDISDLCNSHPELYDIDGVHFLDDFYPLWGMRIVTTIIENED